MLYTYMAAPNLNELQLLCMSHAILDTQVLGAINSSNLF
jgi:hypothetical protein